MVYCASKLIENWNTFRFTLSYFIKAIDQIFYGFTGVITYLGFWENTRKSLAFGSWFTSFSRVLPTSRLGYYAGKPIESVVFCLSKQCKKSIFSFSDHLIIEKVSSFPANTKTTFN